MWVERLAIVALLGAGVAFAGDEPAGAEDRETRCRAACEPVVTRCVANLQGVFGDMREHCERITLQKCLRDGPGECEEAGRGLRSAEPGPDPG
jgi:hypothetical protein